MRSSDLPAPPDQGLIDRAALDDALDVAVARCGRLSDEQVRALRQRRRRIAVALPAVAASVAGLAFVGLPSSPPPSASGHWTADYVTHAGQRGSIALVDGTTISLGAASTVRIDYSATRRSARLIAGQAYFDVRHDRARPFWVDAGKAEVRVLGTAFDVDLTGRRVAVAVYRGAVGFNAVGARRRVIVRAGYRSSLRGGEAAVPVRFDPSLPDWRQGWINAAGMRLDDLVDVLRRQGATRIVPPTERVAAITVTGRFRTDHPRELLGAIGDGFGFAVVQTPAGLVLEAAR